MVQNGNYCNKRKILILSFITFVFVGIVSSTTMAATATSNSTLDQVKTLKDKAQALYASGKYNESITYYDKALVINPNDVGVLTGKGFDLLFAGKKNDSITHFDKVLTINPKDLSALTGKGLAL